MAMKADAEAVARRMRATLGALTAQQRAADSSSQAIGTAASQRADVVESGLSGLRASADQSDEALDPFADALIERQRLQRLQAVRQ